MAEKVPGPILPHGGVLVNRLLSEEKSTEASARAAKDLPRVSLKRRERCDLESMAVGVFSPLQGFMTQKEFEGVVGSMHLPTGEPWTIPVTLSVSKDEAAALKVGADVALFDPEWNETLGVLHLADKYPHDREREAREVYRTSEAKHPGVALVLAQGEVCLGGAVDVFALPSHDELLQYRLTPMQVRREFDARGWRKVAAFQTRNPVHRAHEYLQKCALEVCDGVLLHPLVGETAPGDIPADVRMRTYEVLLDNYYPKDRVLLAALPASMRYAGPREAVFHAIMRKNYGCTHFIVGRDHAGVGNYYGTYDAQKIFDEFDPAKIGITPLMFENTFWCNRCEGMASFKTCPHGDADRLNFSGSKVRSLLAEGKAPPQEVTRPEVAAILIEAARAAAKKQ